MKIIWICLLSISTIFASEYYAKLEPIESYQIKSAVSGKVIYSNSKIEGLKANNSTIIEIDSMGAERRSMVMKLEEKTLTAYHEAGHAIVGLNVPHDPVYKVSIIPRGRALGVTMF